MSDEHEFTDPNDPNRKNMRYSDMMDAKDLHAHKAASRHLGFSEEEAHQRAIDASMNQMRLQADVRAAQAAKAAREGGDAGAGGGTAGAGGEAPWKSSGNLNDEGGSGAPWKSSGDLNDGAGGAQFPNTGAGREAANALRTAEHVANEYNGSGARGGRPLSSDELAQRERETQAEEDYRHGHGPKPGPRTQPESAQLGKGYNPDNEADDDKKPGRLRKAGRKMRTGMKNRRRAAIAGAAFSALGVVGGIVFMSLLPFQLHHIMQNIDAHTFARLQGVDTEGRSSKWVQAYMLARLMDLGDGNEPNFKPDENLLFRAKRVDNNKPWKDWYKTIRTTRFEKDVFQKHGITFTSIAKREGNQIIVRPAKVMVNNKAVFEYNIRAAGFTADELKRALAGDIEVLEKFDRMTGQLKNLIRVEVFDGDKSARKDIKKVVKEMVKVNNVRSWNAIKRYHIRKDIQNMTGIRDWKFFETSREKWKEKKISARNKLLAKALPANLKSGKFLRCMFGIDTCRTSTDPYSPDNRNLPVSGRNAGSDRTDSSGNPIGTGEASLEAGITPDAESSDFAKKIARQLIKAGGMAASVVPLVSSLAIFDENVNNHTFSGEVEVARFQQMIAFAAEASIASSQLNTSEVVGDEVDDFMGMFVNVTNSEGWETVVNERPNVVLAAGEFVPASNKKEYCSEEHQAALDKPENYKYAANEFAYHCPGDQIGAVTRAALFEDSWNNGLGKILHPVLQVWRNTVGAVEDIFNAIVDAVLGPIMEGVLALLGLDKKIEEFMGWVGEKVLAFSGAGPMWNANNIERKAANFAVQGRAATAEAAARGQGAALTTPEMEKATEERYFTVMQEKWQDRSFASRYLSLEEPDSMASNALFALVNRSPDSIGRSVLSSMGSLFSVPLNLLSKTVHAADEGVGSPYTAARKIAAIPTFDFPMDRCIDRDVIGETPKVVRTALDGSPIYGDGASGDGLKESMTPQNATNAVELGVMRAEDLNWDLMLDKDRWYAALYEWADDDQEDLETVKKVWNCALLDNAVAGGLGGLYGYQGVGALSSTKTILKNEE